ncbi:MAG: hypothetical protein ACTSPE_05965 [Candidatus Thorarchaeota archaeon]
MVRFHRYTSWILAAASVSVFFSGYTLARDWLLISENILNLIHRLSEIAFVSILIIHTFLTLKYFPPRWLHTLRMICEQRATTHNILKLTQNVTAWIIVGLTAVVVGTGLSRFNPYTRPLEDFIPFEPHVAYDVLLGIMIVVHLAIGGKYYLRRQRISGRHIDVALAVIAAAFIIALLLLNLTMPQIGSGGGGHGLKVLLDLKNYSYDIVPRH